MKLANYLMASLLGLTVACSTSVNLSKKEAEEYVEENLERIMLDMETDYKLKSQDKPGVRVTDATELGILKAKVTWIAKYNPYTDSVTIYANNVMRKNSSLDAQAMWDADFKDIYKRDNIETAMKKSLVRYYLDKISEEVTGRSFPFYTINMTRHERKATTIIIVGLSEEINTDGGVEPIKKEDYDALQNRLRANLEGVLYMSPIESRGIEEALGHFIVHDLFIEYKGKLFESFVKNPPMWWQIMHPVGYQKTLTDEILKQDSIKTPVN